MYVTLFALTVLFFASGCKPSRSIAIAPDAERDSSQAARNNGDERIAGTGFGSTASTLGSSRVTTPSLAPKPCFDDRGEPLTGQVQEVKPNAASFPPCYSQSGVLVYEGTQPQRSCYDELTAQVGPRYENLVHQNIPGLYQAASQQGARAQAFLQSELQKATCAQLKAQYP